MLWFNFLFILNSYSFNNIYLNWSGKLVGKEELNICLLGPFKFNTLYNFMDLNLLNYKINNKSLKNLYLPIIYVYDFYYLKNPFNFMFFVFRLVNFYKIVFYCFFVNWLSFLFNLLLNYISIYLYFGCFYYYLFLRNIKIFSFNSFYKRKFRKNFYRHLYYLSSKFMVKRYKKKVFKRFNFLNKF